MFRNVSFNFATAILKFDTFSSYHIIRTQITMVTASFSLFALSELVCTKNVFYPILLIPLLSHPELLPLWSVPDGRTTFFTPCYLSSFFSLSVRGPTRRRNSTGLAELWGGWPIEQAALGTTPQNCRPRHLRIRSYIGT
jgi:hypothetical protein